MNGMSKTPSPCLSCTRVANPLNYEKKQNKLWKKRILARWALIHAYPHKAMDKDDRKPSGVSVGGRTYAPPERMREYLATDPCTGCLCPRDLCTTPCRVKETWVKAKEERL